MLTNSQALISLVVLTLFFTIIYYYIFSKNHESYINYWGLSWTMYTLSLFFSILLLNSPDSKLYIALKLICDLLNSLFLLGGTYLFVDKKIPRYWIQFLLLNLLWITLAVYYDMPIITITFIASLFFTLIALVTGFMLFRYWRTSKADRIIGGIVFVIWGLHKAYYPFLYPTFFDAHMRYTGEIIFANILNFSILVIYLQKIRSQLSLSEKRFRLMADNAKDMIYLLRIKPTRKFEYISPSAEKMIGYEPEAFYENPNLFSELVHPEDQEFLELLTLPDHINAGPVTMRFKNRKGDYIWTEQHTTVLLNEENEINAIEGIVRDITDRKGIEEEMVLSEKSRHLLLTNISHELKTPITSILGYVTALIDGTISAQEQTPKYLELIRSKSLRLQRLIQDLFQLTQLESGQTSFNFSQLTLHEFIDENVLKYEYDINHAGIRYKLHNSIVAEKMTSELIVDVERIDQVLSNLVFNAIRYTPAQGLITINFSITDEGGKEMLLATINDTGSGIRSNDLEHVFERFYRGMGQNGDATEGSGLGLTISKEIIEVHHGSMWAESQENRGSSFSFTLPLYNP